MAVSPFTGFLRGWTGSLGRGREAEAARVERQMARDTASLQLLAESDDEEVKNAAIMGLVNMATGQYQPKSGLSKWLGAQGPVNPNVSEILGLRCWPSLEAVPGPIEVVDVERLEQIAFVHSTAPQKGCRDLTPT